MVSIVNLALTQIVPKGPSIDTVLRTEAADFFPFLGWIIVKFTSGGIDNGDRPICDELGEDEENFLTEHD